ncbi:MAG: hypothetical protein ABIO17_07540 [Pseudoxanthomonas sp.]
MPSPRANLTAAASACLQRILIASGYATNAGQYVTLEPGQIDASEAAVIAVFVERQQRATDAAVQRTHRLTDLAVVVKVPAKLGQAQTALDLVLDDVEKAMADQQFRYPAGIQFPQFASMQPVPADPGMGWIGAVIRYTTHIPIQ